MYLVQYIKILKKSEKKCCSCFYELDEALKFSKQLANRCNIRSVVLSSGEFTKPHILYRKEKYFM